MKLKTKKHTATLPEARREVVCKRRPILPLNQEHAVSDLPALMAAPYITAYPFT